MTILTTAQEPAVSALGDPDSWVEEHGDVLLRFALTRVSDTSTAEDLVQETLLAAWRGREAFDGACEPRTWLIAILKRRVADHYRQHSRRHEAHDAGVIDETPSGPASFSEVGPDCEAAEFWEVVSGCTGDLPEHLGRAFRLRTFGEEQPDTICDAEGITRKNLSVRLHRARQLLRRCLETKWFANE